jgi:hypothetical protein
MKRALIKRDSYQTLDTHTRSYTEMNYSNANVNWKTDFLEFKNLVLFFVIAFTWS